MKSALYRFTVAALLLLCFLSGFQNAAAAGEMKQIDIPSLNMSVSCPEEYSVITQGTGERDSVWERLGMSREDGKTAIGDSILLACVSPSEDRAITVSAVDNEVRDLSDLSEKEIESLIGEMEALIAASGIAVNAIERKEQSGVVFIVLHAGIDRGDCYDREIQFSTVRNSKTINVTVHEYSADDTSTGFSEAHEEHADAVFRRISFKSENVAAHKRTMRILNRALFCIILAAGLIMLFRRIRAVINRRASAQAEIDSASERKMYRMMVRYVGDDTTALKSGQLYGVLSVDEKGWYRVTSENGKSFLFPPNLFEIVQREEP